MNHRPDFLIRRFLHHTGVRLSVWRHNRQVARAFRDPLLAGGGTSVLASFRSGSLAWTTGAMGLLTALAAFHAMRGEGWLDQKRVPLEAYPAVPAPETYASSDAGKAAPAAPSLEPATSLPEAAPEAPAPAEEPTGAAAAGLLLQPQTGPELPGSGYGLVASKRDRTLFVYRREGWKWEQVAGFPMAYGRYPGDKADAGDRRTPEGRYWITNVVSGPSQGKLYGSLVFTLNYPTPGDQADGKTGQGIWIHGVEAGKQPTNTHGCLSLANKDVLALAAYADIGTPILILSDSVAPDPARQMDEAGMRREYPAVANAYGRKTKQDTLAYAEALKQAKAYVAKETPEAVAAPETATPPSPAPAPAGGLSKEEREAVLARLAHWREDWCKREIDAYAANYAENFRDKQGRDRRAFLERKRGIFESKTKIEMSMGTPELVREGDGRVKATFRQEYVAEGGQGVQRSSGVKTLGLEAGPQGWFIVNE